MEQDAKITSAARVAETSNGAEPASPNLSLVSAQTVNTSPAPSTKWGAIMASEVGNLHLRLCVVNAILFFCPRLCLVRFRTSIYRLCGIQIGRSSAIIGNLAISGGGPIFRRLRIGSNCVLNAPLHLDLSAAITIGDGVCIGHHVVLITTEHEIGPAHYRCGVATVKPITIGKGCWIGARATILPGVTLGEGCIVSAGAVVSNDVPPNKVVAGNPARPVKSVD